MYLLCYDNEWEERERARILKRICTMLDINWILFFTNAFLLVFVKGKTFYFLLFVILFYHKNFNNSHLQSLCVNELNYDKLPNYLLSILSGKKKMRKTFPVFGTTILFIHIFYANVLTMHEYCSIFRCCSFVRLLNCYWCSLAYVCLGHKWYMKEFFFVYWIRIWYNIYFII